MLDAPAARGEISRLSVRRLGRCSAAAVTSLVCECTILAPRRGGGWSCLAIGADDRDAASDEDLDIGFSRMNPHHRVHGTREPRLAALASAAASCP